MAPAMNLVAHVGAARALGPAVADHGPAAIDISCVDKTFDGPQPIRALQNVSLTVPSRQFVSILGPSGCGKSTLLNIIAGFEAATAGRVRVAGEEVRAPHPLRAVVFQEAALFPWLNVWENVTFGPKAVGMSKSRYVPLAYELLDAVGLRGFEKVLPAQLSGGMKQRVGIARALIMRPSVLLMDEPFGSLDAQTRLQMQELLLSVWERFRKTIVFITHDMDEAILLSDVVYVMSARPGRLRQRIEITIPRPRSGALLANEEFNRLRGEIFALLHAR
jgi:NitT/TauT family transport system ATP-binding protein